VAFENRRTAGHALAAALGEYRGSQTVVLGITRGGMAVAAEVAAALHLPLDALVVHKIAEPGQPVLGIAAVAEPDHVVVNQRAVQQLSLPAEWLAEAVAHGIREVSRRASGYRGARERHDLTGQRVNVVDDSAATGVTLQAAVAAVRAMGAREVIIAVPVLPAPVAEMLRPQVDRVVCLATPADLVACDIHYPTAYEVSDDDIRRLVQRSTASTPGG
jgi:putative phosphoribosyl transferase